MILRRGLNGTPSYKAKKVWFAGCLQDFALGKCFFFAQVLPAKRRPIAQFRYIKIQLGSEAQGDKTKEINYSSLSLDAISFVLFP